MESLILSLLIDAYEGRNVTIADVVRVYLLANMEDYILVKLSGDAVNIMYDANKRYTKYIATEKGKKVIYTRLTNALYGCMKSAMLWYENFKAYFGEWVL